MQSKAQAKAGAFAYEAGQRQEPSLTFGSRNDPGRLCPPLSNSCCVGARETILGKLFARISWIAPKQNAGSSLKHEESYQQVDAAENRISGFLL